MNIKKKIRKAYESVPMPAAEDVLPAEAFEKKEKRGFAVYRPVIYVAAALCICVIVTVAAVMNKPGENVIADDTAIEDTTEVTTCEEVWAYLTEDDIAHAAGEVKDPLDPEDPYAPNDYYNTALDGTDTEEHEELKVLVKRSDGKVLIQMDLASISALEVSERFEERYGFDYYIYQDTDRLRNEGIPRILNREYRAGDDNDPRVIDAIIQATKDYRAIRREIYKEHLAVVYKEFNIAQSDEYYNIYDLIIAVYVEESDIEAINDHEYVYMAMKWIDYRTEAYISE